MKFLTFFKVNLKQVLGEYLDMQNSLILSSIFSVWFDKAHLGYTLGYIIAIICGLIIITELYTIITQKTEPDLLMMLFSGVIGGVLQGITGDALLAILAGLCWLMFYSVWTIRESPVWRELMLASLISYIVILIGRIMKVVMDWHAYNFVSRDFPELVTYWGLTGQQWFGIGWNVFIYVFFALCIIFFGRRFFLVSRLTSPQIIYLLLFAVSYFILFNFSDRLNIYFTGIPVGVADRVLFASFGTYEIMVITNFILYLISGPLLQLLFGVKKTTDERVLKIVDEVKQKLGIRGKIRVGSVRAPILNAFAYGAFFDKRIAFMSKELSDFTDDDIRGIAGHELAHASRIHTFWLFIITTVTYAITKALQLPATPLDYVFDPTVSLDFLWYYLYNVAILVFSYFFIRMLEGRADMLTMKAGYGKALAKSLVKLDGFYQGIASEMGLSVYLLTDKEQTKAEKLRFLGDAGRNMYAATIKPNNVELFINLLASHPKSAYRVVALAEQEKLPPIKAAMLPILLLIPFLRRKYLRELQETRTSIAKIIDETFEESQGKKGVINYDKLSHLSYQIKYLEGKEIVAISKVKKNDFIKGTVNKVKTSNNISTPIILEMKTENGKMDLPFSDFSVFEMAIGQKHLFKNGQFGVIEEIGTNVKKFAFKAKMCNSNNGEIKELTIPGISTSYLESIKGKEILLLQKGVTRLARLDELELNDKGFAESTLTITMGNETKNISGDKFVVEFKPFDIYLKKGKEKQQRSLVESLAGKQASLQTKDDLDTLLKGKILEVKEDTINVETLEEIREVKINRVEFLYLYEDSLLLIYKPNLSFVERIFMYLQNRRKLAYIIS